MRASKPKEYSAFMMTRFSKLGIDFPFFFAPMVGLSHVATRELIRSYCPTSIEPLLFTEMLSTRRLPNEKMGSTLELSVAENERFFIPQILGNEEKYIAPSIERLMGLGPWGIDINMGCPVSHTLKHNWGIRLMGDVSYAAQVVSMTKKHSPVPVSVKLRGGLGDTVDFDYLNTFTKSVEESGADWITVHARCRAQKHKGDADWNVVQALRAARTVPIVANGGIQTAGQAIGLVREGVCDGAMIARAAIARPWIFWQIAEDLGLTSPQDPKAPRTEDEEGQLYWQAASRFLQFLVQYAKNEIEILENFRFFAAIGGKWLPFGHHYWRLCTKAKTSEQLAQVIDSMAQCSEHHMHKTVKFL